MSFFRSFFLGLSSKLRIIPRNFDFLALHSKYFKEKIKQEKLHQKKS